jgi:hypothetical protein
MLFFSPLTPAARDGYQKAALMVLVIDNSGLGVVLLAFELGVRRHSTFFGFGPVNASITMRTCPYPTWFISITGGAQHTPLLHALLRATNDNAAKLRSMGRNFSGLLCWRPVKRYPIVGRAMNNE